jgi:hypothetical protein
MTDNSALSFYNTGYEKDLMFLQDNGFYVRISSPRMVILDGRLEVNGKYGCFASKDGLEITTVGNNAKEAVTKAVLIFKESMTGKLLEQNDR